MMPAADSISLTRKVFSKNQGATIYNTAMVKTVYIMVVLRIMLPVGC